MVLMEQSQVVAANLCSFVVVLNYVCLMFSTQAVSLETTASCPIWNETITSYATNVRQGRQQMYWIHTSHPLAFVTYEMIMKRIAEIPGRVEILYIFSSLLVYRNGIKKAGAFYRSFRECADRQALGSLQLSNACVDMKRRRVF